MAAILPASTSARDLGVVLDRELFSELFTEVLAVEVL